MALTGCSGDKECPAPKYPVLKAIDKIPSCEVVVKNGAIIPDSVPCVKRTTKALRVSEHYYYTTLADYSSEFHPEGNK